MVACNTVHDERALCRGINVGTLLAVGSSERRNAEAVRQPPFFRHIFKNKFGNGGTANVAQTYESHVYHISPLF